MISKTGLASIIQDMGTWDNSVIFTISAALAYLVILAIAEKIDVIENIKDAENVTDI